MTTKNYYECHVTLDKKYAHYAQPIAEEMKFKTSKIDGDPVLGDKVWFYCTKHAKTFSSLDREMRILCKNLEDKNIPWVRRKIEHIVLDERNTKDEIERLEQKYGVQKFLDDMADPNRHPGYAGDPA